jgi:hypothetical protein
MKVPSHSLPNTDHLLIVCDGTHPDRPVHDCVSLFGLGI